MVDDIRSSVIGPRSDLTEEGLVTGNFDNSATVYRVRNFGPPSPVKSRSSVKNNLK